MDLEPQYWWAIIGMVLLIVEIFSPSFFAASLAIGAFFAAIAGHFGSSLEWQLGWFSIFSLVSVFFIRPLAKKYLYAVKEVKTNADALIGKTGLVVKDIVSDSNLGRVAIDGDEWQSIAPDDFLPLQAGTKVRVVERDSIILTVEPIKK